MPLLLLRPQPPEPPPPRASTAAPVERQPVSEEATRAGQLLLDPGQSILHLPPVRHLEGLALLLVTALMWGTYAPSLRLIYSLHGPPSPAVVAAARGCLQLAALLAVLLASLCRAGLSVRDSQAAAGLPKAERPVLSCSAGHSGTTAAVTHAQEPARPEAAQQTDLEEPLLPKAMPVAARSTAAAGSTAAAAEAAEAPPPISTAAEQQAEVEPEAGRHLTRPRKLCLALPPALVAALELGLYNTTGTLAQAWGLSLTTAARGAFLIQASTLFTPLLAAAAGMAPSRQTALGSLAALAGTLVIASDQTGLNLHMPSMHSVHSMHMSAAARSTATAAPAAAILAGPTAGPAAAAAAAAAFPAVQAPLAARVAANTPAASLMGDGLIIFAALCYSASTVRIPAWAVHRGVPSLHLALGKSAFLAAVSAAALGGQAWHLASSGCAAEQLWPGWRRSAAGWVLIAWSALGPGALAAYLHVKGQTLVSPTAAQVVFCSVPLWSALLAAAVLPSEPLGPLTLLGGCLIAAGGAAAAAVLPARWRRP